MVPPYTPKWKWAAGIQYEVDLGDTGSITPRLDANYQSDIFSNAVNGPNNQIEGYTLANARLTWRNKDEDLEVALSVTNLFDKYYLLTSFDLTGAGAGFVAAQPGRPREWAITVKKEF
jgi:iron complex outermembrane receptor protein